MSNTHPSPLPSPGTESPPPSRTSLDVPRPVYGGGRLSAQSSSDSLRPPPSFTSRWDAMDPRTSSTQSLAPSVTDMESDGRRRLLIVYIHGFYGNDQSFRSFPAHVHNYVKTALAESHVVHSKVYPKYKTYKAIELARDNFSHWLEPHENEKTDLILVGHSMGGLLAADIVLTPNTNPYSHYPYKHRILGTMNLDAPLLGLHPGIIVAGISSLFRPSPWPEPEPEPQPDALPYSVGTSSIATTSTTTPAASPPPYSPNASFSGTDLTTTTSLSSLSLSQSAAPPPDPTFNPPFFNDILFKERPFVKRLAHFAKKHRQAGENIVDAATNHILSHLEFGGVLADFPGLNARYNKLRALEDVDDLAGGSSQFGGYRPREARVRFVNYYTLSTGIPKKPKTPAESPQAKAAAASSPHLKPEEGLKSNPSSGHATPRISVEDYSDGDRTELLEQIAAEAMEDASEEPRPASSSSTGNHKQDGACPETSGAGSIGGGGGGLLPAEPAPAPAHDGELDLSLPPIPPAPERPQPPDLTRFADKNLRKQAEKEGKRAQKAYDQAIKDRDRALRERQKLLEKRSRKAQQEAARHEREDQQRRLREEWVLQQRAVEAAAAAEAARGGNGDSGNARDNAVASSSSAVARADTLKVKERKFCTLPRKSGGERDRTWVGIRMDGFDEVGAHCGLFMPGPHYDRLVGDVGQRIVDWVQEDMSRRAVRAMS